MNFAVSTLFIPWPGIRGKRESGTERPMHTQDAECNCLMKKQCAESEWKPLKKRMPAFSWADFEGLGLLPVLREAPETKPIPSYCWPLVLVTWIGPWDCLTSWESYLKILRDGAREMVHQVRALAALLEDQNSIPSTHTGQLKNFCNFSSSDSITLFSIHWLPNAYKCMHTSANTHTLQINKWSF